MKRSLILCTALLFVCTHTFGEEKIDNPQIDFGRFTEAVKEVEPFREKRRVDVETFIALSKEPGTIILDARSEHRYNQKHIKGAVHLNYSDFTENDLADIFPSKDTKILIYCNNNFTNNSPAFLTKTAVSLNVPTFITLYEYGYRNLYELGPAVDENETALEFVSN